MIRPAPFSGRWPSQATNYRTQLEWHGIPGGATPVFWWVYYAAWELMRPVIR